MALVQHWYSGYTPEASTDATAVNEDLIKLNDELFLSSPRDREAQHDHNV